MHKQGALPELLIPASSLEVLRVAVRYGADAVYIGGEAFSLRAKAKNFSMQEMQEEGIICGYHTMIDWEKTGIERVTALIEVRVTPQRGKGFDDIAERIYKYPEVDCTYLISGGYDLMVILEGKTLKEVSGFVTNKLSTLDTVISTATHFILKKYKDHGTIMTKKYEDQRELVSP